MSDSFEAIVITRNPDGNGQAVAMQQLGDADLMDGDTLVAVEHSSLNYKDALALTGRSPVVRRFPMVPGIDLAGRVLRCGTGRFNPGDPVVLNGFGVGETHFGGFAGRAQVKSDWLIPMPEGLSTAQAMAFGTAGYTAALSALALEKQGITPESGEILVTGAAGGVGSVAVALLHGLGYRVVASSRRAESDGEYLRSLGAGEVIDAGTLSASGRPLGPERWAGAIDSVGSHTLANVLASTRYGGTVAACGLAQGFDLPGTMMPFILRGVRLIGVDSVMASLKARLEAWALLARTFDSAVLERITTTTSLAEVPQIAADLLAGTVRGRVVVKL